MNIGVYLFLIISGYLYGRRPFEEPVTFYKKELKKVLIPYYIMILPVICLYLVFKSEFLNFYSVVGSIFLSGTIKGMGHLWFLPYILICYLMLPVFWLCRSYLADKEENYRHYWIDAIVLLLVIQIIGFLYDSYFYPQYITAFIVGFSMAASTRCVKLFENKPFVYLFGLVAIVVYMLRIILKYTTLIEVENNYQILVNGFCTYSQFLFSIGFFMIMLLLLRKAQYSRFLTFSDKLTYPLYLVHGFFILSPFSILGIEQLSFPFAIFLAVLLSLIAAMALNNLSSIIMTLLNKKNTFENERTIV